MLLYPAKRDLFSSLNTSIFRHLRLTRALANASATARSLSRACSLRSCRESSEHASLMAAAFNLSYSSHCSLSAPTFSISHFLQLLYVCMYWYHDLHWWQCDHLFYEFAR